MKLNHKIGATLAATTIAIAGLTACSSGDDASFTSTPSPVAEQVAATTTTTYKPLTAAQKLTGLLDSADVYYSSEEAAVSMAELICEQRAEHSQEYVLALLNASKSDSDTYYSEDDMISLYAASVVVYCPEFS
ncbi:hypothetical protein SEA_LILYPAD_41 [Gordonia phage LilyPad]|nr:hypothetical protein SEA_LILYPAD_41 [Gordonia phage LilyPad]